MLEGGARRGGYPAKHKEGLVFPARGTIGFKFQPNSGSFLPGRGAWAQLTLGAVDLVKEL